MILLILENELLGIQVEVFKFHYDSINSMRPLIFLAMSANLNSIMILLIPQFRLIHHLQVLHLNSIMILLIPMAPPPCAMIDTDLNSIMILLIQNKDMIYDKFSITFKFHYDSINSNERIRNEGGPKQI